jgi:hypothetical protein
MSAMQNRMAAGDRVSSPPTVGGGMKFGLDDAGAVRPPHVRRK